VTSELTREAYDRGLEEIDADHILVLITLSALPKDTLIAYNKIKTIRDKAINGEDFETLAKKYSEEPKASEHGGKLGYFSVFSMVYNFENAAYNTKVGEISEIVRTEFGYHIIKINDRRIKKHQINVSHIMIFENEKEKEYVPEERINELYSIIMQGESFESVAKQFSEDRNTAIKGGLIKTFGAGDLRAPLFEEAAYALKEEGDISKPIRSSFGWHIIRLNKKFPLPTFEEEKEVIESKVNGGARAFVVTKAVNNKIKEKYGYQEGTGYSPYMNEFVSDSIYLRTGTMLKSLKRK
jgi:Parvulin-like peptidyl-prolyl isomerase